MPFQGIRLDFTYNYDQLQNEKSSDISLRQAFIIWPEFEDKTGDVILDDKIPVDKRGTAKMWVINPERRLIHIVHIKVGMTGYFMEGKRIAECTVIEILGLATNPVTQR